MKKLIVSCDGTWNTPEDKDHDIPAPTNVVRLYNALEAQDATGNAQVSYYHPGVGAEGSMLEKLTGGAYGRGISRNIMSAYRWLSDNYVAGDEIYLFGFSRGAFTARSLGGLIGACGIADLRGLTPPKAWERIEEAYALYRVTKNRPPVSWPVLPAGGGLPRVPIQMVGVWDTVGSLGVPDDLGFLNIFDNAAAWAFHDTQLGSHVRYARHAVAMDERRASFTPTLWTDANDEPLNDGRRVRQLWFPGVHCDVGGGYASAGLSDRALRWMIDEATAAGLRFKPSVTEQIKPDHRGVLHDSLTGAFKALRTRPRNRPWLEANSPHYDESAWKRSEDPPIAQSPYHKPSRKLAVGETTVPIPIYARNHWNPTGLFLEVGATYEFTATGEWVDRTIASGPDGMDDGKFQWGEFRQLVGSFTGKIEELIQKQTDNPQADILGSKRDEKAPWFALIGAIANDGPQTQAGKSTSADGSPYPHQTFVIGAGPTRFTLRPTEGGYLYAFANDAWHFYANNTGSVSVTVKRIS